MSGEKSPRSESAVRTALGFLYRLALTGNQNTNQAGIRAQRTTDAGFVIAGHAHFHDELLDAQVDSGGETIFYDIDEILNKFLIVKNEMTEDVTLNFWGDSTNLSQLLDGPIVLSTGDTYVFTLSDPWSILRLELVGPASPTGGNVIVEGERQT